MKDFEDFKLLTVVNLILCQLFCFFLLLNFMIIFTSNLMKYATNFFIDLLLLISAS